MSTFGFCPNKCKKEVYEKTEVDTLLSNKLDGVNSTLTSSDNVNDITASGKYYCAYGNLPSNLPVQKEGVLEVITSNEAEMVYKYYVLQDEDNTTYEKHISAVVEGAWQKIIKSGDFAVLTGTITLTNGSGSAAISYPNGYTIDNCVPISIGINIAGAVYDFYENQSTHVLGARLGVSTVTVNCISVIGSGSSGNKPFKIVLMKI